MYRALLQKKCAKSFGRRRSQTHSLNSDMDQRTISNKCTFKESQAFAWLFCKCICSKSAACGTVSPPAAASEEQPTEFFTSVVQTFHIEIICDFCCVHQNVRQTPVWFKRDQNHKATFCFERCRISRRKNKKITVPELNMASAELTSRPGPAPPGQGSSAVSAVRRRTSLHVSFGLGQETWNRISSNASFLQRVFYTKLNRRGSTSFVWNSGRKPAGSSTWTAQLKEAAAGILSRALQAPFPPDAWRSRDRVNVEDLSTHKLPKRDTVVLAQRVL